MLIRLAAAAALLAVPGVASADSWRVGSGADYTSGMYGESRSTEVLAISLNARYVTGRWTFRASVPYLFVDGPANVAVVDGEVGGGLGGGDVVVQPGPNRASRSGFGDSTLQATYSFNRIGGARTYFDAIGKVRLPSGDQDEGLGSDAVDVIVGGELGHSFSWGGAYVGAARRFLGDSDRFAREDGWQVDAGGWLSRGRDEVGAYWTWREASVRRFENPQEVGAYVARRVTPHWRVQLGASAGLSDSSPDLGTSLTFTYRSDARR